MGHYINAVKQGKTFHKATPKIIFVGWFFILLFVLVNINKLHILWLYPISILIIIHLVNQKAFHEAEKEFKKNKK